jgi:hypothetical protein
MSNVVLIVWMFAVASIGWAGGVVLGIRLGRANPSRQALESHDEAVAAEFKRLFLEGLDREPEADRG